MTIADPTHKPRLRHLEAFPIEEGDGHTIGLRDPSGLSDVMLSMSAPAMHLLTLMDGSNTITGIGEKFQTEFGQDVASETIEALLDHLENARFLEGDGFEAHYESLLNAYREGGVRHMPDATALGIVDDSGDIFEAMLADAAPYESVGMVRGLVAPHLDYPRGAPCYGQAYTTLRDRPTPDRVVILGTNHFGRSTSVVATGNDFETPLGRTVVDRTFIEALEADCGHLRGFELDHAREHSVALQVGFVQYLFGAEKIKIVPILCPDPCGPTGTAPYDGNGVDLSDFAETLRKLVADDDDQDTLVIAGADLSHVGASFGDQRPLDDEYLEEVSLRDRAALERLQTDDGLAFVNQFRADGNPTSVCSAGCLFVIRTALPDANAHLLRYHQAVDQATQCCVTCAAMAFV